MCVCVCLCVRACVCCALALARSLNTSHFPFDSPARQNTVVSFAQSLHHNTTNEQANRWFFMPGFLLTSRRVVRFSVLLVRCHFCQMLTEEELVHLFLVIHPPLAHSHSRAPLLLLFTPLSFCLVPQPHKTGFIVACHLCSTRSGCFFARHLPQSTSLCFTCQPNLSLVNSHHV